MTGAKAPHLVYLNLRIPAAGFRFLFPILKEENVL